MCLENFWTINIRFLHGDDWIKYVKVVLLTSSSVIFQRGWLYLLTIINDEEQGLNKKKERIAMFTTEEEGRLLGF